MKRHTDFQPGSLEWLVARSAIPTASEFDNLVTPEFEVRKGQMPQTYLHRKLAEWWLGGPLAGFNTLNMDFGALLESEAKPWYELETGEQIESVALCTTDDGLIGCSPDGLLGSDCGIEIKCPEAHTHVGYVLGGELPKEYRAQVHGSMLVTEFPRWKFLSYRRRFPNLLVEVPRDEEIQEKLAEALAVFLAKFQSGKERLMEIHGGPPSRLAPAPPPEPEHESDPNDVPS